VRYCAVVSVTIAWVVNPPMAVGLGYGLDWGVVGGWVGFCAEIIVGAALLWWRVERGHWKGAASRQRAKLGRRQQRKREARLQPA